MTDEYRTRVGDIVQAIAATELNNRLIWMADRYFSDCKEELEQYKIG